MTSLLVTGAGGMLGANLVLDALAAGLRVIAVDSQHPLRPAGVESLSADLSRPGAAFEILSRHRPDWVIHCAAATNVDACEADPAMAFGLNRDMAGQVAMATRAVGARLAHISTDAVFDGERGGYSEADETRPVNVYGQSKREGELVVLAEQPQALVVRTNIYGWNAQPKHSLAEWFLARLQAGQACPGFQDAWFSPILVNDLGQRLLQMLAKRMQGIYHVAGGECTSKYEFGRELAEVFGLDPGLVHAVSIRDSNLPARRGRMLCLDCARFRGELGRPLPGVQSGLRRFRDLGRTGRPAQLKRLSAEAGPPGSA